MTMINAALVCAMMPGAPRIRLAPHLPHIDDALEAGAIGSPMRIAAFMAHLAHESGEYRWMEELADGSAYEGRADLGNVEPGDGPRYKGRGPIQITGRANYRDAGAFLGLPLLSQPELLARPEHGTLAAAWFWRRAKPWLNPAAELGWFRVTTRLVNGGYNGWPDRVGYYQRNRYLLGLEPYTEADEDASIRAFQAAHGLVPDGDCGPRTLAALLEAAL